jgi:site-specific DNA-methyltransferase (adenine-specific)
MIDLECGDCRLSAVFSVRYDVMITDPPYAPNVHRNATSQSRGGGTRHRELGFDHIIEALRCWTCEAAAKAQRWSCIFSDVESITLWRDGLEEAGAHYIRAIPWARWSMPQLSGDRPPQGCEMVIIAYGKGGGRKHWNGLGNLTHLNHTCLRGEGKHKAEKPLDLMLDLVNWFSDEGEIVFDPMMGAGTTGVACTQLARKFIGKEIDPVWFEKASARIHSPLSERDSERHMKWLKTEEERALTRARIKANTDKQRAKLEESKNVGVQ